MNWNRIGGNWKQFTNSVRGHLENIAEGTGVIDLQRTLCASRLQQQYGITRYEVEKQICGWGRHLRG
ncbi:MAG: hypothetical protein QM696_00540 [Steroidobacteraceae bacterium]